MKLVDLNKNCVSHIFFFLDLSSLGRMCLANKRMNEIGCSDLLWKKKYQTHFGNLPENQSKRFKIIFNKINF